MKIDFNCTINIDILSPKLKDISTGFSQIMQQLLQQLFQQIVTSFAEHYIATHGEAISCDRCRGRDIIWKTHRGKQTSILTIFGIVQLYQMQIQCNSCKHKMYITRRLLGIEARKKIPLETIKRLGLLGALTTYRVARKIVGMFGIELNAMVVWRSVQRLSKEIALGIDPAEEGKGEADGTGIPIQGIKKRGKELKIFVQLKKSGGVRVAGLSIGDYDSNWDKLFKPLLAALKKFKNFLLVTDGDTSILKGLGKEVKVLYQRCLWHIPHQFKWYLWKDKVKKGSAEWIKALSVLLEITNTKNIQHDKECVEKIVELKNARLTELISKCEENGWRHSATYLRNAQPDMFTSLRNRLSGKTTSRVERVMKTVNMRINVGKWSQSGALNVNKIRLAHYYNGYNVE